MGSVCGSGGGLMSFVKVLNVDISAEACRDISVCLGCRVRSVVKVLDVGISVRGMKRYQRSSMYLWKLQPWWLLVYVRFRTSSVKVTYLVFLDCGPFVTFAGTTILEGISSTVSSETEVVFEKAPDASFAKGKGFAYAVVVVGELPYAEYVGDNTNLTIPEEGIETIQNVCGAVKCVVVLISGRPLVIEPYLSMMDAFVAAWLPGTEGNGVSDVLFGDFPFEGKLSRTWFKRVDQLPMNVLDKHYDPLFPYGFGLHY